MALLPVTAPGAIALAIIVGGLALARWRRYPWSFAMAVICIAVFVVQLVSPRCTLVALGFRTDCVVADLSFIGPFTWAGDRPLTPFTYMFVHADLLHIAGNMFILLTAGPALEERIGSRNFLIVYVLAGLGAAASSLALWQAGFWSMGEEFSPNIGASGAIFGVLTGFAVLYPREKLPMILPGTFMMFWMGAFWVLMLYLALNLVYVFGSTNIAWWGHFAGFLVGLAVAPVLQRHMPARKVAKGFHVDTEALRPLARSNAQRNALRELDRLREPKTHDDRRMAEMWWERFVHGAQCPVCARQLQERDGSLVCPQGDYEVRAFQA